MSRPRVLLGPGGNKGGPAGERAKGATGTGRLSKILSQQSFPRAASWTLLVALHKRPECPADFGARRLCALCSVHCRLQTADQRLH